MGQRSEPGFDPWVGKIPWRREGYPLQYSGLENSMDCTVYYTVVYCILYSTIYTVQYYTVVYYILYTILYCTVLYYSTVYYTV